MNNLKKLKKDIDKWVITTLKHTYKTNDTSERDEKKNGNEEKTLNNWQVNHNFEANATWTLTKHT